MNKAVAVILAAIIALVGAVTISVTTDDNGHATVTITTANNKKVEVPKPVLDKIEKTSPETDLGNESATSPAIVKKNDAKASTLAPRIEGPPPLASPVQAGCLTRSLSHNFSFRSGVRPSLVVLHYTVSPNRAGWSDVNGIVGFFNQSATAASSNYVVDNEGHCVYMVPETAKAWAQAGFNSATACSIEIVNTGSESTLVGGVGGAGEKQLARIVRDCAHRWGIPLRRGATSGCSVVRSGVVDHFSLGSCGGGHHDVSPFGSLCRRGGSSAACVEHATDVALRGSAPPPKPINPKQVERCKTLYALRKKAGRPGVSWTASERARAVRIKATFKRNKLACKHGKIKRIV